VERPLVLDARPVVAFLAGEAAADEIAELLRGEAVMSVANAAEVVDVLVRVRGLPVDEAQALVLSFLDELAEPAQVSLEIALSAGAIRGAAHRRRQLDVSLADCIAIATAGPGGAVATSDSALATVARDEGVEVIALPDSRGRRPRA
jgi:predicted nucleic acid-binding protein